MEKLLEGKWALVTGASRGIGAATALRLAEEGVHVVIHYRSCKEGAEETLRRCTEKGVRGQILRADLGTETGAESLADEVFQLERPVEILVNNAGFSMPGPLWSFPEENWRKIQRINVDSPRILIQRLLPPMIRGKWGRIVNLSSVLSTWGGRGNSAYAVSKAALNALTRTTALEVARKGVTVNAIAPGLVETDMVQEMGDEAKKEIVRRTPVHRGGNAEEIAEAVVFLCRCGYVTGEVLYIDGGLRQSF